MTKVKQPLLFLFCATLLVLAFSEDLPTPFFEFGSVKHVTLNSSQTTYQKFHIADISPKYDLSIIAYPRGDTNLEIYLSSTEKNPNSIENSEYYSKSGDYSSMYVPESDLTANTDYYLGLTCVSKTCDFDLTIDYAQEFVLRADYDHATFTYFREGTLVARVAIPEQMQAEHIVISAEVRNLADMSHGIRMYINKGNEIPTSTKYDMIGLVAWQDGKAALIYKGDQSFCTGCNYTVTVEAPEKSILTLRRTVYGHEIPFRLNTGRDDAVEMNKNVTYVVNISSVLDSEFIAVELIPFYGTTQLLVNLGNSPTDETTMHNALCVSRQIFLISLNQRYNNLLYITVKGATYSTYTLKVYEQGKTRQILTLGEPLTLIAGEGEISNSKLTVGGQKDMKMSFTLESEMGQASLFVKSCEDNSNNCSFTLEEMQQIQNETTPTSQKNPILLFSNTTSGDQEIKFSMDGTVCGSTTTKGATNCYFAVGVLPTKTPSGFTLTATQAGILQPLRVGSPIRTHIMQGEYQYYYFGVPNDTGVDSVNFQVTKITGNVDVFISREVRYPDLRDKEDAHHYNDLYSFERTKFDDLNGTYYIAVRAGTSATYSIVPSVKYNESTHDLGIYHLNQVKEGFPQKIILSRDEPTYFLISPYVEDKHYEGIEIVLDEVHGKFIICARHDGQRPEVGYCIYSSNTSVLVIPKTTNERAVKDSYYVGVFPVNTTSKPSVRSFIMTYAATHTYRPAVYNIPLFSWVNTARTVYFKLEVYPNEDNEIVIHKSIVSPLAEAVTLYLANSETKLGHNVTVFNADITSNNNDTLTLNTTDIENLCDTSAHKCFLYMALATASTDDIEVTMTLTKDFDNLKLSEGLEVTYPFPNTKHVIHMYYYPHHLESVTLMAKTYGRNITLYANVINTWDYSSRSSWKYPTNKTHSHKAQESVSVRGESRLHIPATDLTECLNGGDSTFRCGLAVSLYYGEVDLNIDLRAEEFKYTDFSMFSIIASQEITPIAAGKPIHTSVEESGYRYFSLYVDKDEATLLISASVLSGQHVTILATKGKDARPTIHDAEFGNYYGRTGTFEISGANTRQGTAKGYWTIAIYGYSYTEFVLNIVYEAEKMTQLSRGLPVTAQLTHQPMYFEYYHDSTWSFEIKITKEFGVGIISIKEYTDKETVAGNLPTKEEGDYIKRFSDDIQTIVGVSNRSSEFKPGRLYIIGIFPQSKLRFSLVTLLPGFFIRIQDNMIVTDFTTENIPNKYECFARTTEIVDVNIVVYSGSPKVYIAHNPTVNETHNLWNYTDVSPTHTIRLRLDNAPDQGILTQPVWDGSRNVYSSPNAYYIVVVASEPANYSIAVSYSNSTRTLIGGHLDFGFLNVGEFNLYRYSTGFSADSDSPNRIKLQFDVYKDEFYHALNEHDRKPNISVIALPRNLTGLNSALQAVVPNLPALTPIHQDIRKNTLGDRHLIVSAQYEAAAGEDFYILVNNTNTTYHMNYSIIVNSHEPVALLLNNMYASRVSIGESDVYAIRAGHSGSLVIEIHECMGSVTVQTSASPKIAQGSKSTDDTQQTTSIDDESFTGQGTEGNTPITVPLRTSSLGDHISLAVIKISEPKTIYVMITAVDGEKDSDQTSEKDAVYKIKANLYPASTFYPFLSLEPGAEGMLNWDATTPGKLKIGFGEVHNKNSSATVQSDQYGELAIQYHYELILTKRSEIAGYYTRCDMLPSDEGIFKGIDHYEKTIAFEQSDIVNDTNVPSHKYVEVDTDANFTDLFATMRITAIGVDSTGKQVWDYPVVYETTQVQNNTKQGASEGLLLTVLIVLMVLLILALAGAYYYYQKLRRVKAVLNYHVEDLSHVKTTVEMFEILDEDTKSKKKGGYAGLIEESV